MTYRETLAETLRAVDPIAFGAIAYWYEGQPGDAEDGEEYEERLVNALHDVADRIAAALTI